MVFLWFSPDGPFSSQPCETPREYNLVRWWIPLDFLQWIEWISQLATLDDTKEGETGEPYISSGEGPHSYWKWLSPNSGFTHETNGDFPVRFVAVYRRAKIGEGIDFYSFRGHFVPAVEKLSVHKQWVSDKWYITPAPLLFAHAHLKEIMRASKESKLMAWSYTCLGAVMYCIWC